MYFEDYHPPYLGLVMEWAGLNKNELLENWDMVQKTGKYVKIEPYVGKMEQILPPNICMKK